LIGWLLGGLVGWLEAASMHPPLTLHKHPACAQVILLLAIWSFDGDLVGAILYVAVSNRFE